MSNKNQIKHPKDQFFYRTVAFFMELVSLKAVHWDWFIVPNQMLYRIHSRIYPPAITVSTLSEFMYLFINYEEHDFTILSMIITITLITLVVAIKVWLCQTKQYKTAMENFMTKIHLYNNYVENPEEYVEKTLIAVEKITRWTYFWFSFICYVCAGGLQTVTVIHNIQNNESINNITTRLEILVHFWMPIDYEFNFINWFFVQGIMFYCALSAMIALSLFDCLNLTFIYHIIGHIKILKHCLDTTFYKNMTQVEIKINLVKISQHFKFIQQSIKIAENAFGVNVSTIYLHNLIGGGLLIYQLMTTAEDLGSIIVYGLLIPLYMGFMIMISLSLESLRIEADNIPDLVYALNWESMSIPNQKLVLMLLMQVQPPLEFNASFNMKTGMQPAINIIKTAFSYYVMIKSSA